MAKLKDRYFAFDQRLGSKVDLDEVDKAICHDYRLGIPISHEQVREGYEDFNVALTTTKGKYFVKIFSVFRSDSECKRLAEILQNSIEAGVSIPKILESEQGYLDNISLGAAKLRLVVTDFISGSNFLKLGQPSLNDIKKIVQQAAKINSMVIKPTYLNDDWSVLNFTKDYAERKKYMTEDDNELILTLMKETKKIDLKKLPQTFVHGDIISTNVLKDDKEKIWIVDFSCANYYPRIIELAVLTADLLLDEDKSKSNKNLEVALKEYQKTVPLTDTELEALPIVSGMAHAMHVINTQYYKAVHGHDTQENEHFLNKGRTGLRQALESLIS